VCGVRVKDWAELQEHQQPPLHAAAYHAGAVEPGDRVLHLGSGTGVGAQLAVPRGPTVTGLDAAEPMIELAGAPGRRSPARGR